MVKKTKDTIEQVEDNVTSSESIDNFKIGISVVIPYLKSAAQGNELLLALRSWQTNFKYDFHVVIIGDREDWFDDMNIIHIPMQPISDNPQVNTLESLKAAVASDKVTPFFIWSNDDIYILNPIDTVHIAVPKIKGQLDPTPFNGAYKQNMINTINLLNAHNLPLYNYGTHTPFYFEKEKIVRLFEKVPEVSKGEYLFSTLYFSFNLNIMPVTLDWKCDNWLLPVVSPNPDMTKLEVLSKRKFFLNNATTGYSHTLEKFLTDKFPDKSDYEI